MKTLFASTLITALVVASIGTILHNNLLEKHGNREYSRGLLTMALKNEQETFEGTRNQNGCFELPRRENHQEFIRYHQFTAQELEQTFDKMLCWGGLIPADF